MKYESYEYNPPLKVDCSKCGHELFICEKVALLSYSCPKCGTGGHFQTFYNNPVINDFIECEKPVTEEEATDLPDSESI
jgi:hypothetical protein